MGRFSLGSDDSGRFGRRPPTNPTLSTSAGRLDVGKSGRRASQTGTKRDSTAAAALEPVKKACKFGDGSRDSLQSKDESQVGPASESDWAHRQRHPVRVKDCARCAFLEIGPQLRQGHGSYKHEVHGERARTVWLTQKPLHLPGLWGVGCTFSCTAPC